MFTTDEDGGPRDPAGISSLLPSSLLDEWPEQRDVHSVARPPNHVGFLSRDAGPRNTGLTVPQSAPQLQNPPFDPDEVTFQGEIDQDERSRSVCYYSVTFNPYRSAVFHASSKTQYNVGDYVLTEADRGLDIGQVSAVLSRPTARDMKASKMIIRAATDLEVQQLPQKAEREARAMALCQARANDLGLPMNITRAEFQFDGKKLTFYYTASTYIDFRGLVRTLFRVFGTRIWMVCYNWKDGHQPEVRPGLY